ncbi:helicase RepA family protein [Marinobacter lutaoensis]|uniref:helicase RepA family protein n=1 Tax=Marinobacter lutaoensis TaxID=135739 RepID=UPI0015945A7D|nr:helicase RepA family protein [Marinobacter lutaoensis]NVD37128.1 AAA family ATPase [Marinobacter lutaoensis]
MIDIRCAFEREPAPIDYVLPGMVAGSVGAIVSPGGAGKSMAALQIGATLAGGPDLLALSPFSDLAMGRVVYLPAEDPICTIEHRLHSLGKHLAPSEREFVAENLLIEPLIGREPNLMDRRWSDALTRVADGARLLVLDTLRRFHPYDENDSGAMSAVVGRLEGIAQKTGCSILFLHHTNKSAAFMGAGDMQQASRGSSVLVDNIRWQAYLAGMTSAEAESWGVDETMRRHFVRLGVSKMNYGPPISERWLRRHEGGVLSPAVLEKQEPKRKHYVKQATKAEAAIGGDDDNW